MVNWLCLCMLLTTPAASMPLMRRETDANDAHNHVRMGEAGVGSHFHEDVTKSDEIVSYAGERRLLSSRKMAMTTDDDPSDDETGKEADALAKNGLKDLKKILACKAGLAFSDTIDHAVDVLRNMTYKFRKVSDAAEVFADHANTLNSKAEEFVEKVQNQSENTDAGQRVVQLAIRAQEETAKTSSAASNTSLALHESVEKVIRLVDEFAKNATDAVQNAVDLCPKLPGAERLLLQDGSRRRKSNVFEKIGKNIQNGIDNVKQQLRKVACNLAKGAFKVMERIAESFENVAELAANISAKADDKAEMLEIAADTALTKAQEWQDAAMNAPSEQFAKTYEMATEALTKAASVLQNAHSMAIVVHQTSEAIVLANSPVQDTKDKVEAAKEKLCTEELQEESKTEEGTSQES